MSAQPIKQTLLCALARARLQHEQLSVLHGELEILHVQQRLLKLMSSACQRLPNRWQSQLVSVAQAFVALALGLQYAPDGGEKRIAVEGVAGAAQAARDGQSFHVVFGSLQHRGRQASQHPGWSNCRPAVRLSARMKS